MCVRVFVEEVGGWMDGGGGGGGVVEGFELMHLWFRRSRYFISCSCVIFLPLQWVMGSELGSSPVPPGYVGHIKCADAFNAAASEAFGDSKTNLKLLDLGCGTGLLGQTLKEKFGFGNLVGLDVSEDMLEKAKEKGIYNKLICSFVSNAGVAGIENAEFEGVLASGVICEGQIRPDDFEEILRWIKPGKFLLSSIVKFRK